MSLWNKLPKNVVDLIFSYDSTFYDYLNHNIINKSFYEKVMKHRYPKNILTEFLILLNINKKKSFPLLHEVKVLKNCVTNFRELKVKKVIYQYEQKKYWNICLYPKKNINNFKFIKSVIFNDTVRWSGISRLEFYNSKDDITPIDDYAYDKVQKINLVNFHIQFPNYIIMIIQATFIYFQDKIYIDYHELNINDISYEKFNAFIHFLNICVNDSIES